MKNQNWIEKSLGHCFLLSFNNTRHSYRLNWATHSINLFCIKAYKCSVLSLSFYGPVNLHLILHTDIMYALKINALGRHLGIAGSVGLIPDSTALLPIQLFVNVLWQAVRYRSTIWDSVTHVGELEKAPGFWCGHGHPQPLWPFRE